MIRWAAVLSAAIVFFLFGGSSHARSLRLKLGTLAPEGSLWHNALVRVGQRFARETSGGVELKVYPGGVAGDELDMVRKMRVGQLHAAAITSMGLAQIDKGALALQVPMMIESWEELDYIRDRIGPKLAASLEAAGFIVIQWGDAGWIHKFSTVPARTPEEFMKLKLFVSAGDPEQERLWRSAGFRPVPLSPTDVLASLQTGMLEAFGATPLFALSSQWFGLAKHMVSIKWTPLCGATVVHRSQWEKIDAALRPKLLAIAEEEGRALRADVRVMNDKAISAMRDRGLQIHEPSAEVVGAWRRIAVKTYSEIRGGVVPAVHFDDVRRLSAEYRASKRP